MKVKLKTEISEDIKDTEIIIKTNKLTNEIQSIIDMLQNFDTYLNNIVATKNNDIFISIVNIFLLPLHRPIDIPI